MQSQTTTEGALPFTRKDDIWAHVDHGQAPQGFRRDVSSSTRRSRKTRKLTVSSWERLPLEITAEIFAKCLPLQKDSHPARKNSPYLLTLVCRAWYKIVTGLPQMWSTIVLTTPCQSPILDSELQSGARFFEMCLTRSKGALLQLYLRAEFLSHSPSFYLIERIMDQISHFSIIFPIIPLNSDEDRISYFPSHTYLSMPNLTTFEVYNREKHIPISKPDISHLERIINSSCLLRTGIFCDRLPGINGPLVLHNTMYLEVLSLAEDLPLSVCLFILKNIPTLRELSLLKVVIDPGQAPAYKDQELVSALSSPEIFQPFTHSRLKCLALAYYHGDLSLFFTLASLPRLRYLVIDLRVGENISWPQSDFIAFLQRSDCKICSLSFIDQPITPPQLLEILRLPNISNTIDSLSIQNYREGEIVVDNSVLEQLTVQSTNNLMNAEMLSGDCSNLCPNLEDMALFIPLDTLTISKLVTTLKSRSSTHLNKSQRTCHLKALRRLQLDMKEEMKPYLGELFREGFILRLYEQDQYDPSPIGRRQLRMLRKFLNGRGRCVVFDHDTGKWDGLLLDE